MKDLSKLVHSLLTGETIKIVPIERRIRALLGGVYVLDTINAKLVWEIPYYPEFWIPEKDLTKHAHLDNVTAVKGLEGNASLAKLTGGQKSTDILLIAENEGSELQGLVKVDFKAMDQWFEELAPVYYHPKDPYHRVDIYPTSRHIKVSIDGVTVADTGKEGGVMSLWETNFPGRWYLPRTTVDWSMLSDSDTITRCPYKGEASYYNVTVNGKEHKDVVWWYRFPITESAAVAGALCFYPDKVDMWIDGVKVEKKK